MHLAPWLIIGAVLLYLAIACSIVIAAILVCGRQAGGGSKTIVRDGIPTPRPMLRRKTAR